MLDRRAFILSATALGATVALPDWAEAAGSTPSPELRALFDRMFHDSLRLRPEAATQLGLDKGADADLRARLSNEGDSGRAAARSAATAPFEVLCEFGGLEIAGMAGAVIGAAAQRRPVIVDGFIASTAALAAIRLCPAARDYCIFAHRSAERGHAIILDALDVMPMFDLGLRLGEGTGALLAVPLVRAAARLLTDVADLDDVLSGRI